MNFEFATAIRILFGAGRIREAAPIAAGVGKRALVVTGAEGDRAAPLVAQLRTAGVHAEMFSVRGEPSTQTVLAGIEAARSSGCDMVLGIGGGSALDTGKAIAALLTNGGDLRDYLEVIGRGRPLEKQSAPYVAIPTTAGTGSEVTRNAVLESPEHRVKVSLRSPLMLPAFAIVDPELTCSMPPALTASTGLDALTQLIEPLVCNSPNPLIDSVCREGIRLAGLSLRRAYHDGRHAVARERMSLASLFGGLALANARLGAVHGLAGPLGGRLRAPHGAICARLLPYVMEANVRALQAREPGSQALERYREVSVLLTGNPAATEAEGIDWVYALCEELNVLPLSDFGLTPSEIPEIVAQSRKASSMRGNPIVLADDELTQVLKKTTGSQDGI